MAGNKTVPTPVDPTAFLAALPEAKRAEALRLDAIFRQATAWVPRMWGPSIVGYGRYRYRYDSGREGDSPATGFAPRAHGFSVYILPGYADYGAILARLGRHRIGKACLELRRLADIDEAVLAELIRAGVADLARRWPVTPE
jgi:hypothetical protein